jgi:hypothetical protein
MMMSIKLYRTKSDIYQVLRYTGDNLDEVKHFLGEYLEGITDNKDLGIKMGGSIIIATVGDFLIKHGKECYPCIPSVFQDKFEEVL